MMVQGVVLKNTWLNSRNFYTRVT